jgi:hypothetical protein
MALKLANRDRDGGMEGFLGTGGIRRLATDEAA